MVRVTTETEVGSTGRTPPTVPPVCVSQRMARTSYHDILQTPRWIPTLAEGWGIVRSDSILTPGDKELT